MSNIAITITGTDIATGKPIAIQVSPLTLRKLYEELKESYENLKEVFEPSSTPDSLIQIAEPSVAPAVTSPGIQEPLEKIAPVQKPLDKIDIIKEWEKIRKDLPPAPSFNPRYNPPYLPYWVPPTPYNPSRLPAEFWTNPNMTGTAVVDTSKITSRKFDISSNPADNQGQEFK